MVELWLGSTKNWNGKAAKLLVKAQVIPFLIVLISPLFVTIYEPLLQKEIEYMEVGVLLSQNTSSPLYFIS